MLVVTFGGDVLGRAPGFGFFSGSLAAVALLGPFALTTSRLVLVPLTTGALPVFVLVATGRSPGFFALFVLGPSPGLGPVPSASDFMAEAEFWKEEVLAMLDTCLVCVLEKEGLSGAGEGHFTARGCELENTGFFPSFLLSPVSIASAKILSLCRGDKLSHPCVWRTA